MIEPLDLNGPLTGGTVVLEASAGTGKTYALSHRVLREVGENGRAIDQILVVTFTRAAAAEIRRRIRTRLEEASTLLAYRLAKEDRPASDPTLNELISRWAASPQGVEVLLNLLQAIDRIDLAPITTIHGFIHASSKTTAHFWASIPSYAYVKAGAACCKSWSMTGAAAFFPRLQLHGRPGFKATAT